MGLDVVDTFDPVRYSLEECQFLLEHLGEPPAVALRAIHPERLPAPAMKDGKVVDKNPVYYPQGVIPASVQPVLARVYELLDLEKRGESWLGLDGLKASIQVYLDQQAKWQTDKKRYRSAPRFPSMSSYDGKNRPHRGGPGSDSGRVWTYFDSDGSRHRFEIDLRGAPGQEGWTPDWARQQTEVAKRSLKLIEDTEHRRIECPVCQHTESYKADDRRSYNSARARMGRHLIREKTEVTLHRELHTNEFGD